MYKVRRRILRITKGRYKKTNKIFLRTRGVEIREKAQLQRSKRKRDVLKPLELKGRNSGNK